MQPPRHTLPAIPRPLAINTQPILISINTHGDITTTIVTPPRTVIRLTIPCTTIQSSQHEPPVNLHIKRQNQLPTTTLRRSKRNRRRQPRTITMIRHRPYRSFIAPAAASTSVRLTVLLSVSLRWKTFVVATHAIGVLQRKSSRSED